MCESGYTPGSVVDDHLSHGPDQSRGPGPTGTASYPQLTLPTWTCTVAEIARATPPSPGDLRFSSSLRVPASHLSEMAFPIVGSRRQGLRPAPTFYRLQALRRLIAQARTSPIAVPGSSSPHYPGKDGLAASPFMRRDHLPDSHDIWLVGFRTLIIPRNQNAVHEQTLDGVVRGGGPRRTRTYNRPIKSRMLYQLS